MSSPFLKHCVRENIRHAARGHEWKPVPWYRKPFRRVFWSTLFARISRKK